MEIVHSILFSGVGCERGFSKQNIIKTDLCNAMENDILHLLMMVGLEGTDLFGYDYHHIHEYSLRGLHLSKSSD